MTLELDGDGLAKVPTTEELGRRGLARNVTGRWEISAAGRALMGDAMAHNAEVLRADPALDRRRAATAYTKPARR